MPRSSRSKSHKHSKNSLKEVVKEHSEDSEVDIMNVYDSNSKDLVSLEKRKFDLFGESDRDRGGDLVVVSKRRKERGEKSRGREERGERLREREERGERLRGREERGEESKGREVRVEKSSGKEVRVEKLKAVEVEKPKGKEVRVEKLRGKELEVEKSRDVEVEKSNGREVKVEKSRGKEVKVEKSRGVRVEKMRGNDVKESVEVERKSRGNESERRKAEVEVRSEGRDESKRKGEKDGNECRKDVEVAKKRLRSGDGSGDREVKRGRGIAAKDDIQNHEVEKELEKKVQKRVNYLGDENKHQDDMKNSVDIRSSRGDCSKDARHKDERHRDKYQEDDDKDIRPREDKLRKDGDRSSRYKDAKYQEDAEKKNRHRDEKYSEDSYRDNRHQDDKYCKDGGVDTGRKEDKYPEHGDKYDRHNGSKNGEDSKTIQQKEVKRLKHIQWDSRQRDAKQESESDRDRGEMAQDVKFMDRHISKDPDSESDMKHTRNEIHAVDPNQRKSGNYDSSPTYDDRITKYNIDMVKRRLSDKEGHSDVRYSSINEQNSDIGKKSMNSGKVNIVTERRWSNSRKTDVDTSLDHNCRRNSPNSSTHEPRDHYRVSIPEESNHREYGYEENVQHNRKSSRDFPCAGRTENRPSARPVEKHTQKDHRLDARASPLRLADKSPSSISTEQRHLNSSEIRRTLDTEKSAARRGSSRDYSAGKEKAGVDLQKEVHLVDKLSKAEGESSSDLPLLKSNNNSSRNYLPPPPFRTRLDCPSPFGYSEDDTRGRSNNYHRRNSNSNTGSRENAWQGVPNWPSHVLNGFMPLQHVPPVNFHHAMQQFPPPQIFGVRPTMDLNNALPFHIPVTENFPGHGHPLGWQNPVDDSCPPVNGWDAHTHGYVRSVWDQNRGQMIRRGRDTNADLPFGKNNGTSGDFPSISQKEDSGAANEASAGQSGQQAQSELYNPFSQEYSLEVQSCDPLGNIIAEAPKESRDSSEIFGDNNASHYHIYLSRLDISTDLTQPDLYNKSTSLVNVHQIKAEKDNYMMIYMQEILECNLANEIQTDAPFGDDSVFQNAMSLYKKQREDIRAMYKVFSSNIEIPEVFQTHNNEKAHLEKEVLSSLNGAHTSSVSDYVDTSSGLREAEASSVTAFQKSDEPCVTNSVVVSRDQACMLNETEMGVDPVFRQELGDFIMDNKSAMQVAELSKALSRGNLEEMKKSDDLQSNLSASNSEGNKLIDTKCSPMLYSDVSSGACEALMPDLVEFESVNLSHYSESTH